MRYIFCIYERLNKLNEYSFKNAENFLNINNKDGKKGEKKSMTIEKINSKDSDSIESLIFKNFIIVYKALLLKKIENSIVYEELCRDILGNEAYFLFNMDKLISSLIKSITKILSDNLSKDVLNLFKFEINRKTVLMKNYILQIIFNY